MNTYFVSNLCQEKNIHYDPQTHTPGRNGYNAARRQYDAQRNVSNRQQVSSAPRLHRTHGNNVSGKRRERSFQLHRILLFLAFTLLIAFLCGISFGSILSKAETIDAKASETFKYYKSVTVQPGDSLWSIAADNMSEEYDSIQDYIDEVCFINSLSNTCIHAGKNLTIPYYSAEFK